MQHSNAVYQGLKTQFRRLIEAGGGLVACEELTRLGKSQLSSFTDPNNERHAPIDVVADLEAATGQRYVTEALARLHGDTLEAKDGCMRGHVLDIVSHVGGLASMVKRLTDEQSEAGPALSLNERRQLQYAIDHERELLDELEALADGKTVALKEVG